MFGLSKITTAVNRLVRAVTTLAQTVEEVNAGVRQTLRLDRPAPKPRKVIAQLKPAPVEAGE
jgi:hypothetical protein